MSEVTSFLDIRPWPIQDVAYKFIIVDANKADSLTYFVNRFSIKPLESYYRVETYNSIQEALDAYPRQEAHIIPRYQVLGWE